MTYLEAAAEVLRQDGGALHYKEITERAIAAGFIAPKGATPEMTMGSQLYVAVKKAEDGDADAMFEPTDKGFFKLATVVPSGRLDDEISSNNASVRSDLLDFIREMEPRDVELLVGQLLTELGYEEVEVTNFVGDGGIDVRAVLTAGGVASVSTAVQVKRHKNSIGGPAVQQLRGALAADQRGLMIGTGQFSPQARSEASAPGKLPIALVDGDHLVDLLLEHRIGVKRRSVEVLELDLQALVLSEEDAATAKSSTLFPLPGGQDQFFESLLAFLDEVGGDGSTLEEMVSWTIANFEQVSKEKLVKSYLRSVLYSMGLVRFDGESVLLTESGASLRETRTPGDLGVILQERILGISEILDLLTDSPMALTEVHEKLIVLIHKSWETTHQTRFRLQWLRAAGLVDKKAQGWKRA